MPQLQVLSLEPDTQDINVEQSTPTSYPLSINMRTAVGLLEIFAVAISTAFSVTVATGTTEMRSCCHGSSSPQSPSSTWSFIYYCRRRKAWSYAGASVLGALGIILRVVVSTQPSLEVGGGLPVGVTVLYIVLGALFRLRATSLCLELRS